MKLIYQSLVPFMLASSVHAASLDDILNYDMHGIRLAHSIDEIRIIIARRGFSAEGWPKGRPSRWKFEKKTADNSEVYEIHLDPDGMPRSIRYQISIRNKDAQPVDLQAEYAKLLQMATGKTDNCSTSPGGGFQCTLHAQSGRETASLSARTGRGTVYINASR
jgi:hypothetical protein